MEPPSKKQKTCSKCEQCKKKLGLMGFTCKCGRQFCSSHLAAEEHQCSFDYRAEAKKDIQTKMDSEPKGIPNFEKI